MNKPIYLDYMATTPVDSRVAVKMAKYLTMDGVFGNAASKTHIYGEEAAKAVQHARVQVADLINAEPQAIVFTSGATEANNLGIIGAARFYQRKGKHIVTCQTEHKSVLESCHQLECEGFEMTYLQPESNGLLDLNKLENALRSDTILVSIMHVNNEIGVIQDINAIGELVRPKGIVFHVDAAQSAGKLPIDVCHLAVDLMAFSAHKMYGPKGIGALYVRQKPRIRLQPLIHGGGHECGLRSGTLPTHQVVGMGEAFSIAKDELQNHAKQMQIFQSKIIASLQTIDGIVFNGDLSKRIPQNINFCIRGLSRDDVIPALHALAISSASACSSGRDEPSYVLSAMGLADDLARNAIRLSLGRFTTEEEVEKITDILTREIPKL